MFDWFRWQGACVAGVLTVAACPAAAQQAEPAVVPVGDGAPAADERLVDILNYRVIGNTVLPRVEVEKAVLPYLGPKRAQGDVELARAALEKVYRDNGFETVAVQIPEQDVRKGIVMLEVTELKVGRLRVTGSRYFSPEDIRERAPSLAEGKVPDYRQVSAEVAALNKSADRTITPTLRAGDTPGTVDVDLQVEDQMPLHATLELNDRASARTRRLRVSGSVTYANLFQLGHSVSLQGQFAPQDPSQSWIVSGSYVVPFQGTPFALVVYGVHSDSDVGALGGINVLGSGDIVGVRGIYSASRGDWRHTVTVGLDYKNFQEDLILGPEFGRTPIDYMPLTLQYALARNTEKSDFNFSAALNVGLRGLLADNDEFRLKRFNASAGWSNLRLDAGYTRRFANDMRVEARAAAQLSNEPLISNEEFALGGLDSVRGYYESQELGDMGVSGQLDLFSPSLGKLIGGPLDDWRFYGFGDAGYIHIYDALPDTKGVVKSNAHIASVGLGTRLTFLRRLNLDALLAMPLVNRSSTLTDFDNRFRAQFRVWVAF